jgi:phosphate transport system substrate-binding protein
VKKIFKITIALVLLILLTAAEAKEANEPNTSSLPKVVISGTGDNYDLMLAIAKAMMAKVSGVQVEVLESVGSAGGIRAVIAGKADIARVARPLKDNEKGAGLTCQIFAKTPVVFATHPDINGIDNITNEQILGIYSGKITDWGQLGAKPGKIYPLTRESGDSSLLILNEMLPGFANIKVADNAKVMYLTPETVAALQEHKQTICYVPLSAVVNTNPKILKINGIEPSAKKATSGEYKYLIPLGVAYKGQPQGFAKEFIDFLYSKDARKIITEMGAVPAK